MSIPDETDEGESDAIPQGQKEEKEEEPPRLLEEEPEEEPELSLEEQLEATKAELQKLTTDIILTSVGKTPTSVRSKSEMNRSLKCRGSYKKLHLCSKTPCRRIILT